MKITRQGTVHQLTFLPKLFPVNCYLVEEIDSVTLVDAALPKKGRAIQRYVEQLGKPLTRIILTHPHNDHIGSLSEVQNLYPHAKLLMSQRDAALLNGDASLLDNEPQTPIRGGLPHDRQFNVDEFLKEGDVIGSAEVIDTPGHTPGSISLWISRTKTLVVGDALQVRGGLSIAGDLRPLFPFPAMATWNKPLALQSVKKLVSYPCEALGCGHGRWVANPSPLLTEVIRRLERKESGDGTR